MVLGPGLQYPLRVICLGNYFQLDIFYSYGDVITDEALQNLTYAHGNKVVRVLYHATSTGKLDIHLYDHLQGHVVLLPSVRQWSCHCLL